MRRSSLPSEINAEIDFLIDSGNETIPIEVKAETNLKAKSLKTFVEKFSPKTAIRTSMTDYRQEDWLLNLPLWAVETIGEEPTHKGAVYNGG